MGEVDWIESLRQVPVSELTARLAESAENPIGYRRGTAGLVTTERFAGRHMKEANRVCGHKRLLLHDRDPLFTQEFEALLAASGVKRRPLAASFSQFELSSGSLRLDNQWRQEQRSRCRKGSCASIIVFDTSPRPPGRRDRRSALRWCQPAASIRSEPPAAGRWSAKGRPASAWRQRSPAPAFARTHRSRERYWYPRSGRSRLVH